MSDEDDLRDDPDPSDQDTDSDDATPTIGCPHCGRDIYESAEFCHHCGKYISEEDSQRKQPLWYRLGVILCVLLLVLAAAGYLAMSLRR